MQMQSLLEPYCPGCAEDGRGGAVQGRVDVWVLQWMQWQSAALLRVRVHTARPQYIREDSWAPSKGRDTYSHWI